jgi:hypothetical protein
VCIPCVNEITTARRRDGERRKRATEGEERGERREERGERREERILAHSWKLKSSIEGEALP